MTIRKERPLCRKRLKNIMLNNGWTWRILYHDILENKKNYSDGLRIQAVKMHEENKAKRQLAKKCDSITEFRVFTKQEIYSLLDKIPKTMKSDIDAKHHMIWLRNPKIFDFVRTGEYQLCTTTMIDKQLTRKRYPREIKDVLIGYELPIKHGLRSYNGIYYYLKVYDLDYISNVAVFRGFPFGAIRIV